MQTGGCSDKAPAHRAMGHYTWNAEVSSICHQGFLTMSEHGEFSHGNSEGEMQRGGEGAEKGSQGFEKAWGLISRQERDGG